MEKRVTSEEASKILKSEKVSRRYYYPFEYLKDLYETFLKEGDSNIFHRVDNICEMSYKNIWLGCDYMGQTENDDLDIQIYMCIKKDKIKKDTDNWEQIEYYEWKFDGKIMESKETFEIELFRAMLDKAKELDLQLYDLK